MFVMTLRIANLQWSVNNNRYNAVWLGVYTHLPSNAGYSAARQYSYRYRGYSSAADVVCADVKYIAGKCVGRGRSGGTGEHYIE